MSKKQNYRGLIEQHYTLGNHNRMQIIDLCYLEPKSITELTQILKIQYPVTLEHIKILEKGGLIRKDSLGPGKATLISVNRKAFIRYIETLLRYYKEFARRKKDPMFKI